MMVSRVLAAALVLGSLSARGEPGDNLDGIREAFLAHINAERSDLGFPPLRLSTALCHVAQSRAEEILKKASAPEPASADRDIQLALKAGYEARLLSEIVRPTAEDVASVIGSSSDPSNPMREELRHAEIRDLGVGVGMAGAESVPVYVFLFSLSWEDFFREKSAELSDTGRVRRGLLERLNRERARRGLPALRPDARLDRAAQAHAEDMLRRSYYGHESPEGSTALERARSSGYRPHFVAENIASGQYSVEEVMDGWISSDVHRDHIVSRLYSDVGSGVAIGKNAMGYRVLWVQCFGRPVN